MSNEMDWRIINFDETEYCNKEWLKKNHIEKTGVYYVYDHNRRIHICSLTPSYELFAMVPYINFDDKVSDDIMEEAYDIIWDAMHDRDVIHVDCHYHSKLGVPWQDATKSANLPEREEDQDDEDYYMACVESFREQFNANYPGF